MVYYLKNICLFFISNITINFYSKKSIHCRIEMSYCPIFGRERNGIFTDYFIQMAEFLMLLVPEFLFIVSKNQNYFHFLRMLPQLKNYTDKKKDINHDKFCRLRLPGEKIYLQIFEGNFLQG